MCRDHICGTNYTESADAKQNGEPDSEHRNRDVVDTVGAESAPTQGDSDTRSEVNDRSSSMTMRASSHSKRKSAANNNSKVSRSRLGDDI